MRPKAVLLSLLICSWSFAATPDIEFSAPSGIALDLQLFAVGGDTLIETIDCTERTNKKGWYLAASDGAPTLSGTYSFAIMLDGTTTAIGGGYVTVADDESTYQPHLAPSQAAVTVGTVTLVDTTTTNTDMRGTDNAALAATALSDAVWTDAKAAFIDQSIAANATPTEVAAELATYDGPTNAEMEARTLLASAYFDPATDAVANVTLVATTTTNTDMITGFATEAKQDIIDGIVDAIVADTNELQTDWVDGGRLDLILDTAAAGGGDATAANQATIIGLLDTEVADILADTGTTLPAAITAAAGSVTLANGAHGGAAATLTLSDYSDFAGAADPAAIWNYNISAINGVGYSGNYLNNLTTGRITVVGPVLATGKLSLVRGDDYSTDLDNALEWTSDSWTDLTGVTIEFSLRRKSDRKLVISNISGVVVSSGSGDQTVRVEIQSSDWVFLDSGVVAYEYDVQATKNGKVVTLVRDDATVTDDVTR